MRTALLATAIASACLLSACSLVRVDPVTAEEREVTSITDPAKTVTLAEPIVWLNAPEPTASKGVQLPKGTYTLEAEDAEYQYFRAPAPIAMRTLRLGQTPDGPDIPGGLALGKGARFAALSPVAYIDVAPNRKMHVMKLGYDFFQMRGKKWERSF
jgi:hypothetical protein